MLESGEGVVVGVEKSLVASSHEDHEVSQVRAGAHDVVGGELLQLAAFSAQEPRCLVEVEALNCLVLYYFPLSGSFVSEDSVHDALEGKEVEIGWKSYSDWTVETRDWYRLGVKSEFESHNT